MILEMIPMRCHRTYLLGKKLINTPKILYNTIAGTQSKSHVIAKQLYCIQTKMYRSYRKMTINGHFSIWSIHFCSDKTLLVSTIKPPYIRNHLIMNHLIQRLKCTMIFSICFVWLPGMVSFVSSITILKSNNSQIISNFKGLKGRLNDS